MLHLDREVVAWTAERRGRLELDGAQAFEQVMRDLIALGSDEKIVKLSAEAVAEERQHAEIYRALAEEFRGEPVEKPRVAPIELPQFLAAPPPLRPALRVVGMCAVNETMACGFLQLCLEGARVENVREAIRAVLSDEIRHGRIGWAWLASIAPSERRSFSPWLVPLARMQLSSWRRHIAELPERAVPSHGCPSREAIDRAAVAALRDLVLQGFVALGIDARALDHFASAAANSS